MNRNEAPTTPLERSVRIGTIAANRGEGLQAIIEAGVDALADTEVTPDVQAIIDQVQATYEPEAPEFNPGDKVSRAVAPGDCSTPIGEVKDRYLTEDGLGWEYQVSHPRYGRNAYAEAALDLTPAA